MKRLPLMNAAFRTTEIGPDGYFMRFKFRSPTDLQAASDEWRAATAPAVPGDVTEPWRSMLRQAEDDLHKAHATIEAQAAELARLREALEFYAEPDHWSTTWSQQDGMKWARAEDDRGGIARAALNPTGDLT